VAEREETTVVGSHRASLRRHGTGEDTPSLHGLPAPPACEGATVALQLLGPFGLRIEDRVISLPPHVQRLVAFLAVHERPLHRAYVAGRLWIDKSQAQANGCLRTTLWRLQRLECPIVEVTTTHLSLHPAVTVDMRQLASSVRRALRGEPLTGDDVDRLVDADDLLVDCYEDWVLDERERLQQEVVLALEAGCVQLLAEQRHAEAVLTASAAMSGDRLRESAVRVLIEAHSATGNVAEALRRYDTFRAELGARLQLEPSGQLTRLVESIAPGYRAVHA
jgi:DNA-binding SARP family transcriptional activator